jgi:tetratricopeptide (TPR) repeat protein
VLKALLSTFSLVFTTSILCLSAENYELLFSKGLLSFNQGNYKEALQAFTRAAHLKPEVVEIQYYLGLTHTQLENNKKALKAFKKVISLDPTYPRVHYDLGVVYYRLGNYSERAMIYYFKAYILYLQDKFSESLPYFTKAGELDPGLQQTTHFFRGVALLKLDREEDSKEEFQTALNLDPTSELGKAAQRYLEVIKEKKRIVVPKKWSLNASLSYQYDDNVVLEPDDTTSATMVSNEGDSRAVVFVDGEYRFIQNLPWTMGVRYSFYQSIHSRLHDYDLQNHQGTLFGSYQGKCGNIPYQFQLNYKYSNTLLNEKRYLESHGITGTLNLRVHSRLLTQIQYRFQDKDFHYSITHHTANRDGSNNLVGITQYLFLFENRGFFRVGCFYDNDNTNGSNWDYDGYRALAGLRFPFLCETSVDMDLQYYQQEYDNRDYFFEHSRRDEEYIYNFSLYRNIFKNFDGIFRYTRIDNASNIDFYDYDRNIYSLTFSLRF